MLKDIKRIVPGKGGDSTLVLGSEKTAVIDTAMDYCGERLADLLEKELAGRALDYVFLTHSHYDHAGGIPALRRRWPGLVVFGSRHAKYILERDSARRTIRELSEMAGHQYLDKNGDAVREEHGDAGGDASENEVGAECKAGNECKNECEAGDECKNECEAGDECKNECEAGNQCENAGRERELKVTRGEYKPNYRDEELCVDTVVGDGDVISLGDRSVTVLETIGHTNCSLSFLVTKGDKETAAGENAMFSSESVMFPSESIGCYQNAHTMEVPFLTGFQVTLDSIEKCRACRPGHIISPHFGEVTELSFDEYFDLAAREACATRDYILECWRGGLPEEEILERCIDHFWVSRGEQREEQPLPAFVINMKATIRVVMREFS